MRFLLNFPPPQLRPRATPGKLDHPARLHGVRAKKKATRRASYPHGVACYGVSRLRAVRPLWDSGSKSASPMRVSPLPYLTIRIITYITNSARGIREEFKIVPEPGRAGPFGDCESGFPESTKSEAGTNSGAGAGSRGLHGDEKPGPGAGACTGSGPATLPGCETF